MSSTNKHLEKNELDGVKILNHDIKINMLLFQYLQIKIDSYSLIFV